MANTYADTYSEMRWFVERNRLALIAVNPDRTSVDDKYINLKAGSKVRIYGSKIAEHFSVDVDSLPEIPEQYHEAIVYRAIATGYEIPPNQNFQAAQYFNGYYADIVKKARKWKRNGRLGGTKTIVPMDF
tara:strand:+ start:670 stop:1059 length:390 start_codon:yes stop_codon:yes gene_type:complete